MKFSWVSERAGRSGIAAEPGVYDGSPSLGELWMDAEPEARHDDRVTLAAALAFCAYLSGPLDMQERKVSIGLANELTEKLAPFVQTVTPIEFAQRRFADGAGTLAVHTEIEGINHLCADPEVTTGIRVSPSDKTTGQFLDGRILHTASNASILSAMAQRMHRATCYPELAVAVLFAEDLGCDHIVAPESLADPAWRSCFLAAGLRLTVR